MNINIIAVGKIKEKYFSAAVDEYVKRLSRFARVTVTEIADEKIPSGASEKEKEKIKSTEGERILSRLNPASFVIALCIEGTELSSEKLAEKIADVSRNASDITFIIGGSLGLSDAVKERAALRLSFGPVTLPHQLMRVVLSEQIYRAFKINNNETYHK